MKVASLNLRERLKNPWSEKAQQQIEMTERKNGERSQLEFHVLFKVELLISGDPAKVA